MNCQIVFRRAAQVEFDRAAVWYEKQRSGLGREFVTAIESVIKAVAANPDRYPVAVADIHEAVVKRFPFCVYYRVKPSRIVVLAVFHTARDPAIWQRRD